MWSKTYGGANTDIGTGDTVQTSDGGYAVSGDTNSYGAGGTDFWLFKTDASGNMQWNKTYGGNLTDMGYGVVQTNDGGYTFTGYTSSFGAGGNDAWLVRTDASGTMQWNKTYGGNSTDQTYALALTGDGGYALAGYTMRGTLVSAYLIKTDAGGNMLWEKTYRETNSSQVGLHMIKTADGGFAIVGWNYLNGQDFLLIKTDAAGNLQWNMTYGGSGLDNGYALLQTSDGGYVLTGTTSSFGAGGNDVWLVKTDAFGVLPYKAPPAATAFNSVSVLHGWTRIFFVHSNGGVGTHNYQWYDASGPLAGQTQMVLPVTKTTPGTYMFYCKVTDSEGTTANSNNVTLTVMG